MTTPTWPFAVPVDVNEPVKHFHFLLVTDIHTNIENIHMLADEMLKRRERFDAILCMGDIADLQECDIGDPAKVSASEGDMTSVLSAMENICGGVIYIPGNHDPATTCKSTDSNPHLTVRSANIHSRCLEIAQGLYIAGFGGSGPSFSEEGKEIYAGYPFLNDGQLARQAAKTSQGCQYYHEKCHLQYIDSKHKANDVVKFDQTHQIIFLTHQGPFGVDTTVDKDDDQLHIYMGSKGLRDALIEEHCQSTIVCNIHGHTHSGDNRGDLGRIPVINPGPLKEGQYGILDIVKGNDGKWSIGGCTFESLGQKVG